MPLSVNINAPVEKVYDTLNDPTKNAIWNPVTQEVKKTDVPNQCEVKSFMGNFTTTRIVSKKNEEVTFTVQGSTVLEEMSYKLERISENMTKVSGSVKFKGKEYTKMHNSVGNAMLENLKRYIEYIHSGKSVAEFQKE